MSLSNWVGNTVLGDSCQGVELESEISSSVQDFQGGTFSSGLYEEVGADLSLSDVGSRQVCVPSQLYSRSSQSAG